MGDQHKAEMARFKSWQAANLPADRWLGDPHRVEPPRLKGDWSNLDGSAFDRDLRSANFGRVKAQNTKFRDLDLRGADFEKADLVGADFENAELLDATFRDADLRDADFSGSHGLTIESFGGAKLQGASLPEDLGKFEEMENIAEISRNIQRTFQFLLILCGFASLTILSIKDQDLIVRDETSMTSLPVLNASITPITFSFIVPLLILTIYVYQCLYAISLWRLLSFLPAFFPDGMPLDRRAHPTVLNTFIRFHLNNVPNETHDVLQCLLRGMIAFGLPPITLSIFWMGCLRLHNVGLTTFHSALVGTGSGVLLFVFSVAGPILRGETSRRPRHVSSGDAPVGIGPTPGLGRLRTVAASAATVAVLSAATWFTPVLLGIVILGLTLIAIIGTFAPPRMRRKQVPSIIFLSGYILLVSSVLCSIACRCFESENPTLKVIKVDEARTFPVVQNHEWLRILGLNRLLSGLGLNPFIDVRSRFVSHRAANWTGHPKTEGEEMLSVSGVDLERFDLRSMDGERAFLAKANLRSANLEGAYLRFANLRGADLTNARLANAYLRGASLREANLQGADLESAIFSIDQDDPTKKMGANLQGAKIDFRTKFRVADLIDSRANNLALAYFGETEPDKNDRPEVTQHKQDMELKLKTLEKMGVPRKTDQELSMGRLIGKHFVGLSMQGADFTDFNLSESTFRCGNNEDVDLTGALFIRADLTNVKFMGANLQGADFSQAVLDGTTFECCKLEGTTFDGAKAHKVQGLDDTDKALHGLTEIPH